VSYIKVGGVQEAQGNFAGALKSYSDSLAIADRLAKSDPGNSGWQYDLGISNERIGNVQMAQGDLGAALRSYEARQAIISRLATSDPGNAGWQYDLGISNERIGRANGAGRSRRRPEVLFRQPRHCRPPRDIRPRQCGLAARSLGVLREGRRRARGARQLAGALKSYSDSLAIRDRLAKSDPGNAGWQRDLSVSYSKVGGVQKAQGDLKAALISYSDGLAIIDRLQTPTPATRSGSAICQ
jgi:tetratricopeptide (TPR) repeat protein